MQRDERGTHAAVQADFGLMRERCAQMGGEVLNSMGDGLLLCFPSVVQAVTWALDAQRAFSLREPAGLQHRMGIHLGDVFQENGQVAGDGVNIAARLEAYARPGTVCISQSVHDAVRGKVAMQVHPLGPTRLKNIAVPVTAFLVAPDDIPLLRAGSPRPARGVLLAWALVVVLACVGGVLLWHHRGPAAAPPALAPAAVPSNSVAVLPFANMSEERDSEYFADGVHEDLLTTLANLSSLKVISRTSVMQYRGTTKTIRQIGKELGVAYVLEGSVRREANRVRVTGQLIDARTDQHVWAKSYDEDLTDVFAIQAKLSREIASALSTALTPPESSRLDALPTTSVAAYEAFIRARSGEPTNTRDEGRSAKVEEELRSVLGKEPGFVACWTLLARYYLMDVFYGHGPREERLHLAHDAIESARKLDPDSPDVLVAQGDYYYYGLVDLEAAAERYQKANNAYPNRPEPHQALALVARRQGRWQDAVDLMRAAHGLDPRNPAVLQLQATTLFLGQHWDEFRQAEESILSLAPDDIDAQISLRAVPYYSSGDPSQLRAWMEAMPASLRDSSDGLGILYSWSVETGNLEAAVAFKRQLGFDEGDGPIVYGLRKAGRAAEAAEILSKVRASAEALVASRPDKAGNWASAAQARALAGDTKGALDAIGRARALAPESRDKLNGPDIAAECALALAYLGDTDAAVAEVQRLVRICSPVTAIGLRDSLAWLPLREDKRVRALAGDPAPRGPRF